MELEMNTNDYENPDIDQINEGWWQSVMDEDVGGSDDEIEPAAPELVDQNSSLHVEEIEIDWDVVNDLYTREQIIICDVVDYNKGGLIVSDDAFQGFVPISHMDDILAIEDDHEREQKLKQYVGCRLVLKIIECDPRRGRIVLSERAAQTEPGQRQKLLDILEIGKVLTGRVTNVTDFGVLWILVVLKGWCIFLNCLGGE